MKNTFAVTMGLLLALTLGGSYVAYERATTPHHGAEASHGESSAAGENQTDSHSQDVPSAQAGASAGGTPTDQPGGANAGGSTGKLEMPHTSEGGNGEGTTGATAATDGVDNTGSRVAGGSESANTAGATGSEPSDMAAAAGGTNAADAAGDSAAGQTVYVANCAGCHGQKTEGGIGPALKDAAGWSLEDFTTTLREGRTPTRTLGGAMPKFSAVQVSDQDVANIHAFLQAQN